MMRRVLLASALAWVACGPTIPPAPDLIQRPAPSPGVVMGQTTPTDDPTQRPPPVEEAVLADAGCCTVFGLSAAPGEVAAQLVIDGSRVPMESNDAGVWFATRCVGPASFEYYFEVGYPADDDAGVVWVDRINEAVPASNDSLLAPAVNLFAFPDGGTCEQFDVAPYAAVPDAGP
ncbi:MAG: hypothetical protein Q8N23_04500 [Archangium sp.]|nr:hypothetical protein [Archangium sp.]MDP3151903.1 hypothetical protein [Archangium sp.]MDP3571316.1 hypothetical protein [Archangium sp.]